MEESQPPIWPIYEAFYINSMLFNSISAVRSISRIEAVFEKFETSLKNDGVGKLPETAILNELQNMIIHAGALSRYFWPTRRGNHKRGVMLCEIFDMSETSPLRSRELRDSIEHFDERLDNYFAEGAFGCFFPEYVGGKPIDDGVPGHFFRAFFTDTLAFRLLNAEFLIRPIADELLFVHQHLIYMDQNGGRFSLAKRDNNPLDD